MNDEMNGPNFDGDIRHGQIWLKGRWHAIFPREAVLGDIASSMKQWLDAFAYGDQWEEAWKGARTYKYIFNRTHALDSLATVNKRRTDELQHKLDQLESDLRATRSILDVYVKHAERRLKRIDELSDKLKRIGDIVDDHST